MSRCLSNARSFRVLGSSRAGSVSVKALDGIADPLIRHDEGRKEMDGLIEEVETGIELVRNEFESEDKEEAPEQKGSTPPGAQPLQTCLGLVLLAVLLCAGTLAVVGNQTSAATGEVSAEEKAYAAWVTDVSRQYTESMQAGYELWQQANADRSLRQDPTWRSEMKAALRTLQRTAEQVLGRTSPPRYQAFHDRLSQEAELYREAAASYLEWFDSGDDFKRAQFADLLLRAVSMGTQLRDDCANQVLICPVQ